MSVRRCRGLDRRDQARKRSDRKGSPDEESLREEIPLGVHLLESLTFVSEIQDAIVEEFRTALRVFLGEFAKPRSEFVAHFRHRLPPGSDFFQIVLFSDA